MVNDIINEWPIVTFNTSNKCNQLKRRHKHSIQRIRTIIIIFSKSRISGVLQDKINDEQHRVNYPVENHIY